MLRYCSMHYLIVWLDPEVTRHRFCMDTVQKSCTRDLAWTITSISSTTDYQSLLCKQSLSPSTVHTDWIQGRETVCRNSVLHVTFTLVESALQYLNNSVYVWTVSIVWLDLISVIRWTNGWPCRKVDNRRFYHAEVYPLYSVHESNE